MLKFDKKLPRPKKLKSVVTSDTRFGTHPAISDWKMDLDAPFARPPKFIPGSVDAG